MAAHSSTFTWKMPCSEEPGRLQSMGSQSCTRQSNFTSSFVWEFPGVLGALCQELQVKIKYHSYCVILIQVKFFFVSPNACLEILIPFRMLYYSFLTLCYLIKILPIQRKQHSLKGKKTSAGFLLQTILTFYLLCLWCVMSNTFAELHTKKYYFLFSHLILWSYYVHFLKPSSPVICLSYRQM